MEEIPKLNLRFYFVWEMGAGEMKGRDGTVMILGLHPLKLTFSSLKMDGWETILSYWGPVTFQGQTGC